MKIRLDEVVSSSVRRMHCSTDQGRPSVARRCANSEATFRSLLVSRRWMIMYCLMKQSAKLSCRGKMGSDIGSKHNQGHFRGVQRFGGAVIYNTNPVMALYSSERA